jgi:hypothetical protein
MAPTCHLKEEELMQFTRPLEYYRQERLLGVAAFAAFLGITEQTYRRLLKQPQRVRMKTKRQVLERLGLSSAYYVRELVPEPTPEMVADVLAAIDEGDREGSIALDPDTLEPTGERFNNQGELL